MNDGLVNNSYYLMTQKQALGVKRKGEVMEGDERSLHKDSFPTF